MESIWLAIIGIAGPLAGAGATVLVTRWRLRTESHDADEQHVINFYTNELAHCRTEASMWRSLALENMGGLQKARTVIEETTRTGGPS